MRLPALLLQAGTTLLAASLARALAGPRAAVALALMLQAAPVFSVGAFLVTPDAPLAFGWVGALWAVERAASRDPRWWLAVGLFLGIAALAKLHAGLLGLALLAAAVATAQGRRALRTPWPWLAAAIALLACSPFLLWNARHGWATFAFQASHGLRGRSFSLLRLLGSVGGQAGYVSPLLLGLAAAAAWRALRAPRALAPAALAFSALPVATLFALSAAVTPGALPHWAAPAWLSALVLLAAAGAARLRAALLVGGAMTALLLFALPVAPRFVGGPLDELRGGRRPWRKRTASHLGHGSPRRTGWRSDTSAGTRTSRSPTSRTAWPARACIGRSATSARCSSSRRSASGQTARSWSGWSGRW